MQNKKIILIILLPLLIVTGLFVVFGKNEPVKNSDEKKGGASTTTEETSAIDLSNIPSAVLNTPESENPGDQGDVLNQAAYLVRAYDDHGKKMIGVDYVMVLQGDEAVKAQIEDKVCTEGAECPVPAKGYVRNLNPHYRSYEISTTTRLTIELSGPLHTYATSKGLSTASLSFEQFMDIASSSPVFASSTFPFKEAKSFVYLDIVGGGVIKIREP